MTGYIDSQLPVMQQMCDKANEIINNELAILKKDFG